MVKIEVKTEEMRMLAKAYIKQKMPLMIKGAPGIGKSYGVDAVCQEIAKEDKKEYFVGNPEKESQYGFIDVRISQMDPSDLRGIPFPEGDKTRWLRPSWLPTGNTSGVLFFDEINLAPPSIQSACYQLILDRRIGEYVLPDGWTIVAAGNRSIDKAHTFPMAAPLKNRFSHCELLVPTAEEWSEWGMNNGVISDVISFISFKPSYIFKFDSKNKDDAFPTPRSWTNASKMIEGLDPTNTADAKKIFLLVASCVGEGVAIEYEAYTKLKKKINLNDLLKNPKKVKEINDVGMKYSLISGLSEKYKHDRKLMTPILEVVDQMDAEFGVFLLRLMRGQSPKHFKNDIMAAPNWKKIFEKFSKYIF